MPLDRSGVIEFLDHYTQSRNLDEDQFAFLRAICRVKLGEYAAAKALFGTSIEGMVKQRRWFITGEVNLLVEVCALSAREAMYGPVIAELMRYRSERAGSSPGALYAYGLMDVLVGGKDAIGPATAALERRPKLKEWYAKGRALQAVTHRDETALQTALLALLKAHEGIAKHGSWRWSAEGFLSMAAMSLAYGARKQGLRVVIVNDYFSQEYLDYLLAPGDSRGEH